jgi:hypothetical protein
LHIRRQTVAMLDTTAGELVNLTLLHEGNSVREVYPQLPRPVLVGIEATASVHLFLNLMDKLGIECRVGHPAGTSLTGVAEQVGIGFELPNEKADGAPDCT